MNYEKKAERLMELIHDIKHGYYDVMELIGRFNEIFPNWLSVESYNPKYHPSAKDYLFDVVLEGVK